MNRPSNKDLAIGEAVKTAYLCKVFKCRELFSEQYASEQHFNYLLLLKQYIGL